MGELVERLRRAGCVWAEDEARLLIAEAQTPDQLDLLVGRRVAGEPLEYVLGWAEFVGLRIVVEPGVFIPRRRSALIVTLAAAGLANGAVAVDLCCGSGALGAALSVRVDLSELVAVDLDPVAVWCAARNLTGPGQLVLCGDLFDPLPDRLRGTVDVIMANLPYVPTAELALMPREARDHEARIALDGGPDGLDLHRRALAAARAWLRPGGRMIIETGRAQAETAAALFGAQGFGAEQVIDDDLSATVVIGTAPAR